jgi:uncharacterized protein YfiM (DUF2279 family)
MSINATVDPNKSGARGTKKGAKLAVPASTAASYVRASKALADPVSAAAKVGTGKMTPETIDVLRDRRPELRAELQQRFDEQQARLDSKGKALQYSTRVEASLATGKAYDKTMSPSFISMVQAHWTNKRAQSAVAVPMAGAGGGGRGSLRRSSHEQRSRLTRFHSDTEALGYGDL